MSALGARVKRVGMAILGRAGAGAVVTGPFEAICGRLLRQDEGVLGPWGEWTRGLESARTGRRGRGGVIRA